MAIILKRAYDSAEAGDGFRVLVERLWPRGVRKADARIDLWAKEVAPSADLRRWFDHDPAKWTEFKRRYFAELAERGPALEPIAARARRGRVTFVFAAKEARYNNAVALREYLTGGRAR